MGTCAATKVQRRVEGNIQVFPYKVCITAYIWNKETHNLFDFETNQAVKKEIEIDFSATLSIVDNQIVALAENEYVKRQVQILRVDCKDEFLQLTGMSQKSDQRVWAILCNRSQFESINEWELQKGDMLKLGRVKLQLVEFNCEPGQQVEELQPEADDIESKDYEEEAKSCRVCFSKRASRWNPLFSPCKCQGSIKYIHLKCLQEWKRQQIKMKPQGTSVLYIWRKMECEVCKHPLQCAYTYQGQFFCIMQIQRPITPYMAWKITADDKPNEGTIQVMELGDSQDIKIGRVPDCDIKLKDISVSRNHAIIRVTRSENSKHRLLLSDNNSKFGTLLYAQWQNLLCHSVSRPQKVLYQIGRVLMYISIKDKGASFSKGFTCYRHPNSLQVQQKVNLNLNEQATINPNAEKEQYSFQTHNELNSEDIVINQISQ